MHCVYNYNYWFIHIAPVRKTNPTGILEILSNDQKEQLAPTIIIVLIACLSGTILILLIIIGICLIRGPPGIGNNKSKESIIRSPDASGNYLNVYLDALNH